MVINQGYQPWLLINITAAGAVDREFENIGRVLRAGRAGGATAEPGGKPTWGWGGWGKPRPGRAGRSSKLLQTLPKCPPEHPRPP